MPKPADPALVPIYEAGFADGVDSLSMSHAHFVRRDDEFNVFERLLNAKGTERPELPATLSLWKRLLRLYYLADVQKGMDPGLANDRDEQRMMHFVKAFTELGL